jgi:hypothetical protein
VSTITGTSADELFMTVAKIAGCISDSHISTTGNSNLLLVFLSMLPLIPGSREVSRLVMVLTSRVAMIISVA